MIITVTTVVVLIIGLLSLCLALYGGFISSKIIDEYEESGSSSNNVEHKYYLLGMIGIIVLLARLLVVPIYFWMLQSLVPYCPGAMCASGVVNVSEPYSSISLVLKILLPFIYGTWILIEVSNRREPSLPMLRELTLSFLLLLLPLLIIDSAADILLTTTIQPVYAPCCSSIYDVNPPFSPSAVFGPEIGFTIVFLTIAFSLFLSAMQWFEKKHRILAAVTLIFAMISSILYLIALHDSLAPVALGLPNHHCPYCLFQEFPDTAFFAGLFWVGVASAGWRVILETIWTQRGLDKSIIQNMIFWLKKVSSVSLLFSMVSLISHLLVAI